MIGMRMGEHDRARLQSLKFSQPILAAVDHHVGAAIRNHERSVHTMPARPSIDLPARAEKCQFH
jgi:hypothetical protein